jgi:hypothetical protein
MLSVVMLSIVMLSVIMLSVIMLSVILLNGIYKPFMLNVIMLSVVALLSTHHLLSHLGPYSQLAFFFVTYKLDQFVRVFDTGKPF